MVDGKVDKNADVDPNDPMAMAKLKQGGGNSIQGSDYQNGALDAAVLARASRERPFAARR